MWLLFPDNSISLFILSFSPPSVSQYTPTLPTLINYSAPYFTCTKPIISPLPRLPVCKYWLCVLTLTGFFLLTLHATVKKICRSVFQVIFVHIFRFITYISPILNSVPLLMRSHYNPRSFFLFVCLLLLGFFFFTLLAICKITLIEDLNVIFYSFSGLSGIWVYITLYRYRRWLTDTRHSADSPQAKREDSFLSTSVFV